MRVMLMTKGDPEPGAAPSEELLAAMGTAADTLQDVIAAAERGIHRIRHTHHLPLFLRRCGLSLW